MIEEGERLGQVMEDKEILFMCHHGTLVSLILPACLPDKSQYYSLFQVVADRTENDYKIVDKNSGFKAEKQLLE